MNEMCWRIRFAWTFIGLLLLAVSGVGKAAGAADVAFQWDVRVPLRDGVELSANVYRPRDQSEPAPCIFTLTPYIASRYHDRGVYFASKGFPFLTIDVRGRGNSGGTFRPLIQEARDGYDVVEWLARQPYCNGKVAMWGGSYAGYDQWATAKEFPPHLATIVPVASPHVGTDYPMRYNIFSPYLVHWLLFTAGRAAQEQIYTDREFWQAMYARWLQSGRPSREFGAVVGFESPTYQEWLSHPHSGPHWDAYVPTAEQYAQMQLPILTITGSHDISQSGALAYYREYMKNATPAARARHFLVIGPWDHAGTRTPKAHVGGLQFGPASLVDLNELHAQWYEWTMKGGAKPAFLRKPVAYYVMGAETWRYADTLEAVTRKMIPFFLDSSAGGAGDVFASGSLAPGEPGSGQPDQYIYDPRIIPRAAGAAQEGGRGDLTDQRAIYSNSGGELIYHSAPFEKDTELSGTFRLTVWLGIDQPDTDLGVSVFEIGKDGSSKYLAGDTMRARYRKSLREAELIRSAEPLRYDFERFTFVSRLIKAGSRLRLVIAPPNVLFNERNFAAGGVVAEESVEDARTVTVKLFHDTRHPSALYAPFGADGE